MPEEFITLDVVPDGDVSVVLERIELGEPSDTVPDSDAPAFPNAESHRTAEQERVIPLLVEHVRVHSRQPGFRGGVVLASRDHNRVSVYVRTDTSRIGSVEPAAGVVERAGVAHRTLDRRAFDLVWRDGHEKPAVVSPSHSPIVHFGLFAVLDDQADVLQQRIEAMAPLSLGTPGLISVNFHRSHDDQRFVNFGTWTTLADMAKLLDQPGFKDNAVYWAGLALFENDYSDVVAAIAAPVAASQ